MRAQDSLFPPSLEELVPEDHLVRLELRVLGFSKAQPQKTGRPPYTSTGLLKLYL